MPAESVFATVKTIALVPLWIEPQLSDSTRQRGTIAIDSLVQEELRTAGFALVPPSVADSLWKFITDSLGGVFDARTGQRDTAKAAAGRAVLLQDLRERYGADALLHVQVRIVSADFEKWTATWDGTHQTFQNFGGRFMGGLLHGAYKGRTNALSLVAVLENTAGRGLYQARGGLQVYLMPKNGKFEAVPDSAFFADTTRNAGAVRIVLCQLAAHGRS